MTNKLMDGFEKVSNKQMGGLKRTTGGKRTIGQTRTGSGWRTTANSFTLWEPEEVGQVGFFCLESFSLRSTVWKNARATRARNQQGPGDEDREGASRNPQRHQVQNPRGSPSQDSATSEPSGMSETDASNTSETSSTCSVGTQTRLHSDLPSYNNDGGYVAHVVPCAPTVPHVPKENRRLNGLRPSEMRRRKYVVDSDERESANFRANLRDTLEDTIEWRNDNDRFSMKHNGECLNLDEESGVRRSRRVRWIDHQNDQARKTEVQ